MNQKNQAEIRRYLNVIKRASAYIESLLEDDGGLLEQMVELEKPKVASIVVEPKKENTVIVPVNIVETPKIVINEVDLKKQEMERKKHIQDLLAIDCWPESISSELAQRVPTEQDQIHRANAVLDSMLDRSVDGEKFLDYGCGEAWIAQQILKKGVSESWAYDPQENANWKNIKNVKTCSSLDKLPVGNYFDVIMLYDVLDHCDDPIKLMAHVKNCLNPNGTVYVRCHPWTSKHATHLFKYGINKAYFHLFLNWDEIKELIKTEPMFTRPEKNPIEAYHWWFKDFEIKREKPISEKVTDFFHVQSFKELLANEQQIPLEEIDNFLKKMEIQFVNYVLTPKK